MSVEEQLSTLMEKYTELQADYADLKEVQQADYDHAVRNCNTANEYITKAESLEAANALLQEQHDAVNSENIRLKSTNEKLKKAIVDFGNNPAGFDWGVLERIERLESALEHAEDFCKCLQASKKVRYDMLENLLKQIDQALKDANGKEENQRH